MVLESKEIRCYFVGTVGKNLSIEGDEMKKVIIILCILTSVSIVSAAAPDYLKVSASTLLTPRIVESGELVSAVITLERIGTVPDEATLNIVTELNNPKTEVTMDGEAYTYELQEFDIALPSEGVSEIKIRIEGYAPKIEGQMGYAKTLDVTTHVKYEGEDTEYQTEDASFSKVTVVRDMTERDAWWTLENLDQSMRDTIGMILEAKESGLNVSEIEEDFNESVRLSKEAESQYSDGDYRGASISAETSRQILNRIKASFGDDGDIDRDGIINVDDSCLDQAEDFNDYEDDD